MSTIYYNKLIRDKIPEIIEKSGKKPVVEELDGQAYKKHLDIKLGEELQEYLEADMQMSWRTWWKLSTLS